MEATHIDLWPTHTYTHKWIHGNPKTIWEVCSGNMDDSNKIIQDSLRSAHMVYILNDE